MALTGIVNLADRLLNQSQSRSDQSAASAPKSGTATDVKAPPAKAEGGDQFTLSNQNSALDSTAQAAGLFSVKTLALFTAAANFLLGTSAPAAPANTQNSRLATNNADANANPAASSANSPPLTAAVSPAQSSAISPADSRTVPAQALTLPLSADISTFIPPPSITQTAAVNSELQALNTSLAALGLPQRDFAVIDRIASLLQDYNPTAYATLVHQLESLAQTQSLPSVTNAETAAPNTATVSQGANQQAAAVVNNAVAPNPALLTNLNIASPINTHANVSANSGPKGSSGTGGTFRVQDLTIRFGVVSKTQTSTQAATLGTATTQGNAQLQLQELTLTLSEHGGRTTTLTAPPSSAITSSRNPETTPVTPTLAKATAA